MADKDFLDKLLQAVLKRKASDLHLSSNSPPIIRIDGDLHSLEEQALESQVITDMISTTLTEAQKITLRTALELDYAYSLDDGSRFRVNVFQSNRGIAAVFRTIPASIPTLEQLGMSDIFKDLSSYRNGLVLVTGPTGSGKSTTLAAMVDYINKTRPTHILTIEDPIEFVHQNNKALINQRGLHHHTHSFENALRSALREDPDVILVGEMRDIDTIRLALTAAETGHLVFGTLHTTSASKTINRIIDVFPGNEKDMIRSMLSESLRGVVSQALLKKQAGGRCAAHEIMVVNSAIRNLIREDKIAQIYSMIQTGQRSGMQTLESAVEKLIMERTVTPDEARKFLAD
jgi:twitching motility protein PilT